MNFIGTGLVFPIKLVGGSPRTATGLELIHSSIRLILGWALRTMVFNSGFGTNLPNILEEPNDDLLKGLCEYYIYEGLTRLEKRINVIDVRVVRTAPQALDITITFRVKSTGLEEVLTYPFYKEIPN